MTEQEVVKVFNTVKAIGKCHLVGNEQEELFEVVYKALGKQIPKKMDMYSEGHTGDLIYKCPTCRETYNRFYYGKQYCMFCGQKLDWEW